MAVFYGGIPTSRHCITYHDVHFQNYREDGNCLLHVSEFLNSRLLAKGSGDAFGKVRQALHQLGDTSGFA